MARIKHQQQVINDQLEGKILPPFPQLPDKPGKYSVKVLEPRFALLIFAAPYSAKKFLEALLADKTIKWDNDQNLIATDPGTDVEFVINSLYLKEIMEHRYTAAEKQWQLPVNYLATARHIRGEGRIHPLDIQPAPADDSDLKITKPKQKERKEYKKREPSSNKFTATTLAADLNMKPSELRAKLRALKLVKPADGWIWSEDEYNALKKRLQK